MTFWRGLNLRFDNMVNGRPEKALVVGRLEAAMVKFPLWGIRHGVSPSSGLFRDAGKARTGWILDLLSLIHI